MVDNKSNGILGREEFEVRKVKEAFRAELKLILERKDFARNLQNIHTPYSLCDEMIGKLERNTSLFDKDFLVFNIEFCEVLLYNYGISRERIWFITDCVEKAAIMNHPRYSGVHVEVVDFMGFMGFTEGVENMEKSKSIAGGRTFDCIVGNPPYQSGSGNKGSNNILWDKFVIKSIDMLKENGFLAIIHPSAWRNCFDENRVKSHTSVGKKITSKKLHYLEIHSVDDGIKVFGCGTRYDWYILQNCPASGKTKIVDQDGVSYEVDVSGLKFIPNSKIDKILSLVAKEDEKRVEIICNSAYHTYNYNKNGVVAINKNETAEHIYPLVNSVDTKDVPSLFWSSFCDKGHFGSPKVIFGNGATGFFIDSKGEYALTQWTKAIVDTPQNLPLIVKALKSEKFQEIIASIAVCSYETNHFIISTFRKDFWKEFV